MFQYGIGGNEVKQQTSEALTELAQNRTLFIQKLTHDDAVKPEAVYDLKTVEEVFDHFKPEVNVAFQSEDGASVNETLKFSNLGDFNAKNITQQSKFLKNLNVQQEQYQKMMKQLKSNKLMKNVLENPETKAALLDAMKALVQELEDASK